MGKAKRASKINKKDHGSKGNGVESTPKCKQGKKGQDALANRTRSKRPLATDLASVKNVNGGSNQPNKRLRIADATAP